MEITRDLTPAGRGGPVEVRVTVLGAGVRRVSSTMVLIPRILGNGYDWRGVTRILAVDGAYWPGILGRRSGEDPRRGARVGLVEDSRPRDTARMLVAGDGPDWPKILGRQDRRVCSSRSSRGEYARPRENTREFSSVWSAEDARRWRGVGLRSMALGVICSPISHCPLI